MAVALKVMAIAMAWDVLSNVKRKGLKCRIL